MLTISILRAVGATVSAFIAGNIGITGVLFTLANVANIMAIPHPTWMVILTMITFLPLTFAGAALGARVRPVA